ncbi:MAG: hypothetical protein VKJ05_07415 [Synechococcaceae cyanobacterium]|nr:hypothetical protein [Synechococcaceae cyanobacterium]
MNLALPSLVALTLVVLGAVASVPAIVREPTPRQHQAQPRLPQAEVLRVVEAPGDRWYLHGRPIPRAVLGDRLRRQAVAPELRFLPSAALSTARVADSLRWLRRSSRGPVGLELLPRP